MCVSISDILFVCQWYLRCDGVQSFRINENCLSESDRWRSDFRLRAPSSECVYLCKALKQISWDGINWSFIYLFLHVTREREHKVRHFVRIHKQILREMFCSFSIDKMKWTFRKLILNETNEIGYGTHMSMAVHKMWIFILSINAFLMLGSHVNFKFSYIYDLFWLTQICWHFSNE